MKSIMGKELKLFSVLFTALKLGFWAALLNIAWLFLGKDLLRISHLPKDFPVAVVLSSILPILFSGFVYYLLVRGFSRGYLLFLILGIAFLFFSNFPAFESVLPDGTPAPANFRWLVIPMHLIAGGLPLYFLPKLHPFQKS